MNLTHASGDRTWRALAWEAKARIALADGDLPGAQDCIAKAVAMVENFDVPLAAWRVHRTAAALYRSAGNTRPAQRARELSQTIIGELARSLDEPLRHSFLSGASASQYPVGASDKPANL